MYQINQLSFSYETKEVLKNISVTFPTSHNWTEWMW